MVAELKTCRKGLHLYQATLRTCPECKRIANAKWSKNNPESRLLSSRKWQQNNRKKQREKCKKWYYSNKEKHFEAHKKWTKKNPDKVKYHHNKWVEKNRWTINSLTAKRRALKQQAVAAWANIDEIKKIYKEAASLSKKTGMKHHVDHIYPLQSKYMCGLHVETNLQILTAEENLSKSNKVWPGQLDCQKD